MINGVIAMFLCNLLPYFVLVWSIAYFVIFDRLISDRDARDTPTRMLALPIIAMCLSAVFILGFMKNLLNKCYSG